MDVAEVLSSAWQAVEKADLPEYLQQVAFREAVGLVARSSGIPAAAAPGRPGSKSQRRPANGARVSGPEGDGQGREISEDDFFDAVERETGVPRDKLEQVIFLDGDTPRLNLPARRLGSSLKARQVVVGQVLPVVRHYGLDEAETPTTVVREECTRLKCLDTKNINTYLANLTGVAYVGPATNRRLKVRAQGVDAFAQTIDRLLNISESGSESAE